MVFKCCWFAYNLFTVKILKFCLATKIQIQNPPERPAEHKSWAGTFFGTAAKPFARFVPLFRNKGYGP